MCQAVRFALAFACAGVCQPGQPPPVGIILDFATQPESALVDVMKSEIQEILAPARMELSFQRMGQSGASQSFRKIVVVRFQGACQTQADSGSIQLNQPELLEFPALGRTDVSGGRILPYVQVYCNEVRAFIPSVSLTPFGLIYGRALGRVVAHELYHALLSTRDHTRAGVAHFAQTARDLTRDKLALDPRSIGLLRDLYGTAQK